MSKTSPRPPPTAPPRRARRVRFKHGRGTSMGDSAGVGSAEEGGAGGGSGSGGSVPPPAGSTTPFATPSLVGVASPALAGRSRYEFHETLFRNELRACSSVVPKRTTREAVEYRSRRGRAAPPARAYRPLGTPDLVLNTRPAAPMPALFSHTLEDVPGQDWRKRKRGISYASAAVPSAVKRRDQARKRKEDASLRTQLGKFDPHRPSIRMPRSRDDGYAMLREWILDSESRIQSAKTGQTVVPTAPMETAFPLPPMVDHAAGADAGSAMPLSARASSTSRVVGVPSAGGRPATVGSGSLTARGTAGERGITARLLQRMRKRPREDMVPETLYLPYTSRRPMPSPVGIPTLRAFKENHLNDAATSLTEPRTMLATAKRSGGGVAGGGGGSAGDGGASPRRRGSVLVGPASPKRGTLARKASVMGMLKRRKPDSKKRKKAAAMAKNKRLLREMEDDHVKRMDPSEVAALRTEFNPVRKIGFTCHSFEARKGQLQEQLLQTLEQLDRERGLTLKRKFKVLWQGRDQLQKHSFLQEMKIMRLAAEADRLERHIKNYRGTMWYPKLLAHVVVQGRDSLPVEHFMTSYVKFVIDAGFSFERAMLYALVKALTLKELSMFESQRVLAFLRAEVGIPLSEWESFFASNGLPPPQEVVEQHAVHAKQLAAVLSQPRIADSMRAWLSRSKAAGTDRAFAGFHE